MYPQQPMAYPAQPAYPQQPTAYPPQQPQYAPPMPYAPQAQPYGAPVYPAPPVPVPPAPKGTLDDFFEQRSSGGGPGWKFMNMPIGTSYTGMVARPVTSADVEVVTDQKTKLPQTHRDGRYKYQMLVPMVFPPTAEYPDGQARFYVKGQARDELARAMAEAGAPAGPPEAGATIRVTLVGHKPIQGYSPQFIYRIEYYRPSGSVPAQQPAPVTPMQEYAFTQQAQAPMPTPVYQQPAAQFPAAAQPVQAYPMQQFATQPAPGISVTTAPLQQHQVMAAPTAPGISVTATQPVPQQLPGMAMAAEVAAPAVVLSQGTPTYQGGMPAGLDPEQEALFRRLTGQPPQG